MPTAGFDIYKIKELYQIEWGMADILISDEQHPIITKKGPIRIDGYIIGICLRGSICLELNHQVYHGTEKSMLVSVPMQYFQIKGASTDCRFRFIIFSKRFLLSNHINQQILDKFKFASPSALPVIKIERIEAEEFAKQFENIYKRFNDASHPYHQEISGKLLLVLLYDFEAVYSKHFQTLESRNSRSQELARQFSQLVQAYYKEQHNLEFYAKKLFVTPKYLTELVKEATGKSGAFLIWEALSMEAQSLLGQPNISVKQVANMLRFPDQSTFGKFFKRMVGLRPTEYMKRRSL